MHVPIKFLPNLTDPSRTNEHSDRLSEVKKFEDSFSKAHQQALKRECSTHKEIGALLKTPNLETEVDYHHVDVENKLQLNDDDHIVLDTEWLRQEAYKNAEPDLEGYAFVSGSYSETGSLEATQSPLKSGEGHNGSQDTKPLNDLSKSIDDENLFFSRNAKFFLTTAHANSDYFKAGPDTQNTLPAAKIPTTQLLESPPTSFEQIRTEKNALHDTFKGFSFDLQPSGYANEYGTFLYTAVNSAAAKSKIDFLSLLRDSDLTSEALSGPSSLTKFGMFNQLSKVSIILPIKTKLKASVSTLDYRVIQFNENGSASYDSGRVLQSVIGATGSSFVDSEQNSIQFVIPTTLHRFSKNNIQLKHQTGNFSNTENEAFATDSSRYATEVKFSALSDLNAQNQNDDKFDKSISGDAPRVHKLDMALKTWQKVFNSQINKAALENITQLQFSINPKKLGRVSVTLQMDAGNVNVSIFSSNGQVANILQTSEGKLETLLSDHGMKLASFNVNSEQNGREKRDRAPTSGRQSELVERDGPKMAIGLPNEDKPRTPNTHNGDYDYLV